MLYGLGSFTCNSWEFREGFTEPRDFPITREQIRVQSVRSQELEPGL